MLPAAEITFEGYPEGKPRIVGYAAKWHEDSFSTATPCADSTCRRRMKRWPPR